jgi:hypothetical protein
MIAVITFFISWFVFAELCYGWLSILWAFCVSIVAWLGVFGVLTAVFTLRAVCDRHCCEYTPV